MFKVYSPKFNIFVYAFNIHDKLSRDIKLFCPYCTHASECDGVSFVQEHYKNNSLWKSHFRRSRYCKYKNELPKTSEGESAEHLNMKLDVLEYFKSLKCECDLEVRIGDNICDVVAVLDDTKLAIECQISNISHNEVRSRTENYINHGYKVVWLTVPNSSYVCGRAATMNSVQKTIHKVFGKLWVYDFIHDKGKAERTIWNIYTNKPNKSGYTVVVLLSRFIHDDENTLLNSEHDTQHSDAGSRDEFVYVQNMKNCVHIYIKILKNLLKPIRDKLYGISSYF